MPYEIWYLIYCVVVGTVIGFLVPIVMQKVIK